MIEYIHKRLTVWGRWSVARLDGGALGGTHQYSYRERVASASREHVSAVLAHDEALEMEMAVASLAHREFSLGRVVMDLYRDLTYLTAVELAEAYGCGERTIRWRRDKAHAWILDWLHARDCNENDEEVARVYAEWVARQPKIIRRLPVDVALPDCVSCSAS